LICFGRGEKPAGIEAVFVGKGEKSVDLVLVFDKTGRDELWEEEWEEESREDLEEDRGLDNDGCCSSDECNDLHRAMDNCQSRSSNDNASCTDGRIGIYEHEPGSKRMNL
jgi:hypothetical protein